MFRHGLPDYLSLQAKSRNEDVDEDSEEDEDRRRVVHPVQLAVFPRVV